MSNNAKTDIPDRIKSLILDNQLEKPINSYKREALREIPAKAIFGIGKKYFQKLKLKFDILTIADLAKFDPIKAKEVGISQKLLEKWTLSASIIDRFSLGTDLPISVQRVCIAGLGAAGKSSLLKTLQHQKTMSVNMPTMGARIESLTFLGLPITVWDLGGQLGFRKLYLDEPHHYLARIMLLIFVIDIQNTRMDEARQYLNDLIIKLKYMKENPKIYLVLHKCDPNIDVDFIEKSSALILKEFDSMLIKAGVKKYKMLKTSIYDVEGLVHSFSRVFSEISPISKIISDSLAFYTKLHNIEGSFIISESGFITAEWTTRLDRDVRDRIFNELMEEIRKETYDREEKRESFSLSKQVEGLYTNVNRIEFDSVKLFLVLISPELQSFDTSKMNELNDEIKPWIKNFFSIISGEFTF